MRRPPPSSGEWIMMRFCWTIVGAFIGLILGAEIADWFLGWFLDLDAAFWTIILTTIAGGSVGLWLDVRSAREWRNLKHPEDQKAGAPSKHIGRRPRQWTRFRRPQD